MRNLITFLLFMAAFIFGGYLIASAADVHLAWDAEPAATGYKLYISDDMGTTWDSGTDVGNVTDFVYSGVLEDRMILFKVSAYHASGEAISDWRGAWYDHRKLPPGYPSALGIGD